MFRNFASNNSFCLTMSFLNPFFGVGLFRQIFSTIIQKKKHTSTHIKDFFAFFLIISWRTFWQKSWVGFRIFFFQFFAKFHKYEAIESHIFTCTTTLLLWFCSKDLFFVKFVFLNFKFHLNHYFKLLNLKWNTTEPIEIFALINKTLRWCLVLN